MHHLLLEHARPRPIPPTDSVWIEELTAAEVRDAIRAGKTTAIVAAGSTEENGPYLPTGKHAFVLRLTAEAIARKLGNALVAPLVPFEPGEFSATPGTINVRPETFEAFVEDEAQSLEANGFRHVVLIGDSAGDQRGLEHVAKKLAAAWGPAGPSVHYVREYYDSWLAADAAWESLGVPKTRDDGFHDDYSVDVHPRGPRSGEDPIHTASDAGRASINGQTAATSRDDDLQRQEARGDPRRPCRRGDPQGRRNEVGPGLTGRTPGRGSRERSRDGPFHEF